MSSASPESRTRLRIKLRSRGWSRSNRLRDELVLLVDRPILAGHSVPQNRDPSPRLRAGLPVLTDEEGKYCRKNKKRWNGCGIASLTSQIGADYAQASGVTNSQTSPRSANSSFQRWISRSVATTVWRRSWPMRPVRHRAAARWSRFRRARSAESCAEYFCSTASASRRLPVVPHRIPQHRRQPQLASGVQHIRSTSAMGWAKPANRHAQRIFERVIAVAQFLPNDLRRPDHQQRMRHSVVADQMPSRSHRASNLRALLDKSSNHKKCRADSVLRQHLQQAISVGIIRSVVERQGNLAGLFRRHHASAKNLRRRPHARIGIGSRSQNARRHCSHRNRSSAGTLGPIRSRFRRSVRHGNGQNLRRSHRV